MASPRGKQSLTRKLTLVVAAAVATAVVIIAIGALWQEARRHTLGKLDYLNATAAVFASATSQATADQNQREALVALRGVARSPSILYARVTMRDGATLAEIGSGILLDSDVRYESDSAGTPMLGTMLSRTIEVSAPIVQGGHHVGQITLVADNSDLLATLLATLAQTLIGGGAALLVAALVASRLQRWIVRPLLRLTDMVRHISQSHDYSARVDIETDDEVGDLCGGFNTMLGEIQDRERRIIDLALHDSETDLPTRLAFERELAARIAAPRGVIAVAALSVDRFQYVRSLIGYHLANDLLGELGARVVSSGARLMAARISTDVVGCLIEARDEVAARTIAADVLNEAEAPMLLGANPIDVNVSMGLAVYGVHADAPQALIERASIALDQARAQRVKLMAFQESAYVDTASNLSLMTDLMRALDNGEMRIFMQPKFDLRRGEIGGAEVLSRWTHPQRGFVRPDVFVNMAEETGAIAPLTEWVLRRTLETQRRLAAAGIEPSLAINLSGRLLTDADFVNVAINLIQPSPYPIYLEITETATIDNQDGALRYIEALIAAGAHISIDDYGAGLSSLAYLKRIPAHELKIDKGFIESLGEQQRDALLVKSTIDLAHSLGMKVTAEGVETEAVLHILAGMGCDRIQGYLIAKPMPEDQYVSFMQARTNASAQASA